MSVTYINGTTMDIDKQAKSSMQFPDLNVSISLHL